MLCGCGKEMKIIKIVTDPIQIWHILKKIGWPTTAPEFDEPQELVEWDICQLVSVTADGFPEEGCLVPGTTDGFPEECHPSYTSNPDPPDYQFEDYIDPPHWED